MTVALLAAVILSWIAILFVGFLLLGVLRSMDLLRWQMEQLQATTPSRLGRNGLKPGKKAPEFKLPTAVGPEIALSDFAGRKVFLVFVQSGCGPCGAVVPDLNQMCHEGKYAVLVVNNGDRDKVREWVDAFPNGHWEREKTTNSRWGLCHASTSGQCALRLVFLELLHPG